MKCLWNISGLFNSHSTKPNCFWSYSGSVLSLTHLLVALTLKLKRCQKCPSRLFQNCSVCFYKHVPSHFYCDNQLRKKYFDRFNGRLKSLLSLVAVFWWKKQTFFFLESLKPFVDVDVFSFQENCSICTNLFRVTQNCINRYFVSNLILFLLSLSLFHHFKMLFIVC
jgi:hypothetical protein